MGKDVRNVRSVYSVLRGLKECCSIQIHQVRCDSLNMPRSQPIRRIFTLALSFLRQRNKKKKGL